MDYFNRCLIEQTDRLLALFCFIYPWVLSYLDCILRLGKVGWPQCIKVAVRSEEVVMDGRNQVVLQSRGWAIFNKIYKTGMLNKAVIGL